MKNTIYQLFLFLLLWTCMSENNCRPYFFLWNRNVVTQNKKVFWGVEGRSIWLWTRDTNVTLQDLVDKLYLACYSAT